MAMASDTMHKTPPSLNDLTVNWLGMNLTVNNGVPEDACLPFPPHYRIPTAEKGQGDANIVGMAWAFNRATYIYGPPGTGKDAMVHALSAMTRTPAGLYQIQPGVNISSWFFARSFNASGTFYEEGCLTKQLRDGYVTADGRRIPYCILLTDLDRATKEQLEMLRLVMDSTKGRFNLPNGDIVNVLPGTRIFATGNTSGYGDVTGRMVSSSPIDSSILDRFQVRVNINHLAEADEVAILTSHFPNLAGASGGPEALLLAVRAAASIRAEIEKGQVYFEFGHRTLISWVEFAESVWINRDARRSMAIRDVTQALAKTFRVISDGVEAGAGRDALIRSIDALIKSENLGKK